MRKNHCLKKCIATASLMLAMLGLSGCHGSKKLPQFEVPETFDTNQNYEITFWAKNDTNKTQTAVYQQAITDFEKLYPNIKVNMRLYTNYGTIYNDVITNISTGTTPNVCITYPDHIATYLSGTDIVVPLDELMQDSDYGLGGNELAFDSVKQEEIVPEYLKECRFQEHYYALPFMRSTEALYVNKTYLEKMGYSLPEHMTWDFIFEASEKALEMDGNGNYKVNGQNVLIPFIYKSTDNMMIQMLKQKGAGYSTEQGEIQIFNDTTKELLLEIASHGQTKAFSTFKISSYPANFLNMGQCIFAIDSTAGATWMGEHAPLSDIAAEKKISFETAVMEVPQFDTEHPQMISQGPSVCIFNKKDPGEVMASWIFTQYLLSNQVQTAYAKTEGYIPVTTKAQNSDEYQDYLNREGEDDGEHYSVKIQASKLLLRNTENTFVTPVFNGSASLRDAAGQLIENVVKGVRRGQKVDESYLEKQFQDVTSLYRLDQKMASASKKEDLGPLPVEAKILLGSLLAIWICIAIYVRKRLISEN